MYRRKHLQTRKNAPIRSEPRAGFPLVASLLAGAAVQHVAHDTTVPVRELDDIV